MASYSYISDVSDSKMRTKRFAYLDGVFPLGFYIGNSLAGIIKKTLGFYYNFGLGMLCASMAVLYCIFFVQDSRLIRDERIRKEDAKEMQNADSKENSSSNIFNCILSCWHPNEIICTMQLYVKTLYFLTYRSEIGEHNACRGEQNQGQDQPFQGAVPLEKLKRRTILGVAKKTSPPASISYSPHPGNFLGIRLYFWRIRPFLVCQY